MSKYIIEIAEEYEEYFKGVLICGIADGKFAVDVIAREDLEELNSDYINEHFGELQDESYQAGLEDAWEAAKRIFGYEIDGGFPINKVREAFGIAENALFCTADIIRDYTAQEAIDKIKAYEHKDSDRIEVGDEVTHKSDSVVWKAVCIRIDGDRQHMNLMGYTGAVGYYPVDDFKKTGKHYDIQSILEAMRK